MFIGQLALVTAALFSGAAIYVSVAEHFAALGWTTAPCLLNGNHHMKGLCDASPVGVDRLSSGYYRGTL